PPVAATDVAVVPVLAAVSPSVEPSESTASACSHSAGGSPLSSTGDAAVALSTRSALVSAVAVPLTAFGASPPDPASASDTAESGVGCAADELRERDDRPPRDELADFSPASPLTADASLPLDSPALVVSRIREMMSAFRVRVVAFRPRALAIAK